MQGWTTAFAKYVWRSLALFGLTIIFFLSGIGGTTVGYRMLTVESPIYVFEIRCAGLFWVLSGICILLIGLFALLPKRPGK